MPSRRFRTDPETPSVVGIESPRACAARRRGRELCAPRGRGSGIAAAIVAAICGQGRRAGAEFLHGGGGEGPQRLYERVAMGMASRECFLSGKGFQVVAGLEGLPVREIVRRLPSPELSRQPAES